MHENEEIAGSVCDKELRKHGHALSEIPDRLFRGYVREPWGFLIVFLVIDLFCIGALVLQAFLTNYEMYPSDAAISVQLSGYTVEW